MNDETKEMLEQMESIAITGKDKNGIKVDGYGLGQNELKMFLDYITNLKQEIKEANDSITWWTNRFKAVERDNRELKQENERLKAKYDNSKSHQINYNYFKTLYEKAPKDIVIDDLVYKCEDLDNLKQSYEKLYIEKENYKSRCEKAIEYIIKYCIDEEFYINLSYKEKAIIEVLNILQGENNGN